MAVTYTYIVYGKDGVPKGYYHSSVDAEVFAKTLKTAPTEQIKIVRTNEWGESYTYYV